LHGLLCRGLEATAELFEPIRPAFGLVHRAASVLGNEAGLDGDGVRGRFEEVLGEMSGLGAEGGAMSAGLGHFAKVYGSYRPGLFHCYDVDGLPKTNNDLERMFGSVRHGERRCSGRKVGSPGLVVRHGVRLVASVLTRTGELGEEDLPPTDPDRWRSLRAELESRRETRRQQRRFRRDPDACLRALEQKATQ
jgi:hypothetical protein